MGPLISRKSRQRSVRMILISRARGCSPWRTRLAASRSRALISPTLCSSRAAAGLYALEHNVERLAKDHANAARLAEGLKALDLPVEQHTNMVFATVPAAQAATLAEHLKQRNVLVLPGARMRLVTHLDVDEAGIDRTLGAFGEFFGDKRARKTG